jgi:hypothetical protein
VKEFYLFFACAWILLAAINFYRAYAGTIPGWMMTLNHSSAVLSKKQRWIRAVFGLCYLSFGVAHFIRLYTAHLY